MNENDAWAWARTARTAAFARLRDDGWSLEHVDRGTYWHLHEADMREHFPPEYYFDLYGLRTEHERTGQERITASAGANPLQDFTVVRRDGALAAMFCGEQLTPGAYRMWHTNVHPAHRRRGLYRAILAATIDYTRALGFDTIVSEHAPGNNAVLIAKLRAGFRISHLEIDPMAGASIRLKYFHNPEHLAAYELRCGLASFTPQLAQHASGAFPLFRAQIAGSPE